LFAVVSLSPLLCFAVLTEAALSPLSPATVELAAAVVDEAGSSTRFSFSNGRNAPLTFLPFSATGVHGSSW
jgi:hypothetical protein